VNLPSGNQLVVNPPKSAALIAAIQPRLHNWWALPTASPLLPADHISHLRTALADRFDIQRELGQGGMATVYLARDRKHDRLVAIKVLRPELAAALGTERFLREIQIAARLSHPHVLPLHDSGEADGLLFFVMPYVEGETLRQRLDREGPFPVDVAVAIAAEVAGALDYAHHQGVVHRDIKPENILLHAGQAVVSDFGIARAVDAAAGKTPGGTALTGTGVLIGTPLYMSPEQVSGDPVDGRTDVYALGCVLYEMLAGKPPFTGPTAQSVLARHTMDPVPSVRKSRPDVPAALERTVAQALGKAPDDRFASADAFRNALTGAVPTPRTRIAWGLGRRTAVTAVIVLTLAVAVGFWAAVHRGGPTAPPSVAVLPFANQNAGADDQYFADGITDELMNALVPVVGLHVVSRNGALTMRGSTLGNKEIGRRLSATLLLEGTVQRTDTTLSVTAELVEAATDYLIWSQTFRSHVGDIVAVEDSISRAIIRALQIRLVGGNRPLVARGTENPEAHDLYLKGRYFMSQRGAGLPALQRSIDFFKQALALDSSYAQAWAGLAQAYGFQAGFGNTPPGDAFALAKAAALRAVALDSRLALAHASLGFIAVFHDWDWEVAKRELDRALAIDFTEPTTHLYRAWYFYSRGQLEDALGEMRTAQRLDPLNQIFNARVATILDAMGRYVEAEAEARQAIELDSTNVGARGDLAMSLTLQHRYREAVANFPVDTADLFPFQFGGPLAYAYGMAGRRADALAIQRRLEGHARQRYITPETFAFVALGLRDTATALDWLERGYRERSFYLWGIGADPEYDPLHGAPRFERIIRGIGLVVPPAAPHD
jgi:eukaryotic-like serine/threonine-protein kinase